MALDREYFNSIQLNPVKRRYYEIYAVDNLLVGIRQQAELMNRRYEELRGELENAGKGKEEYRKKGQILSEEVLSLREELQKAEQKIAEDEHKILEAEKKASTAEQRAAEAERRAADAERKAAEIQRTAKAAAVCAHTEAEEENSDRFGSRMREAVEDMVRTMRRIYTSGLQTLDEQWQNFQESSRSEVPEDLSLKVSRIASALEEINSDLSTDPEPEQENTETNETDPAETRAEPESFEKI